MKHICTRKECYQNAKNYDDLTGEWYCNVHFEHLQTKRKINYHYFSQANIPCSNITEEIRKMFEETKKTIKKNNMKVLYEDTDIIILSKR